MTVRPGAGSAQAELLERALDSLDEMADGWRKKSPAVWSRKDISLGQLHILMLLHDCQAASVSRLAELLGISMPSVSSVVDRLEESGLARRQRDEADRRVVHVVLSPKGREVAAEASGFRRRAARGLLRKFSAQELEALLTVLAAAKRALAAGAPGSDNGSD